MMTLKIKGAATGIGSLPFLDPGPAVDLVFQSCPEIPFWPQLPKRDIREGMVAQFSENIPCLELTPDGLIYNSKKKDDKLEIFYDRIIAGDLNHFQISQDYAQGLYEFYNRLSKRDLKNVEFIKCHVTGPFTFAASLNDEYGKSLLHDEVYMQVILKAVTMKALWQLDLFRKFGKKMILFFDEPYLSGFGSAYTPITRETVVKSLVELANDVKYDDVLVGVHCCGNTDWSIFTDVPGIDIINFDAYYFTERLSLYGKELKGFFERGGILCWGIVPTQETISKEEPNTLLNRLKNGLDDLEKRGVSRQLLVSNLLISPACGLGTLNIEKAGEILKMLSETSKLLKEIL